MLAVAVEDGGGDVRRRARAAASRCAQPVAGYELALVRFSAIRAAASYGC